MAITLISEKVYYKGSLQGSPPSDAVPYGKAGGDGYGSAFCTRYELKTTTPISKFTMKAFCFNDNTGSSKYLGVYVTPTANSAYHNCYGGKSGITTHTYLRFGWSCTDKGSFTSISGGDSYGSPGQAVVTGLAIPAGTFYVYIYPYQALTSNTQSSWYAPSYSHSTYTTTFSGSWTGSSYTVSYNANGGSGAPSSQTKYQGIALTLSSTKPTKSNTSSTSNSTITISYNANGGSSTPTAGTGTKSVTTTTSYTFKNWNTASGGTGTSYAAGASYTANAAATLYAQYTSSSSSSTTNPSIKTAAAISKASDSVTGYAVSFNANGGSSTPDTITSTKTRKYTFSKWKNLNSGTEFSASTNYTFSVSATLTAQWTSSDSNNAITLPAALSRNSVSAGSYTVTYDANGGSCSTTSDSAARTTSYTFVGWNTDSNGAGTNYNASGSYTPTAATTLYAKWNSVTNVAAIILPVPTRIGYTFKGWATTSSAVSGSTGSYIPNGDIILYAIWEENAETSEKIGIIYIHNGTEFIPYQVFIHSGTEWLQYIPYVHDGANWLICN